LVFYLKSKNGDIIWGTYTLKKNGETITPLKITNDNTTLAKYLGAILHALTGDTSGNQTYISVRNAIITSIESENGTALKIQNLEEFLKNNNQNLILKFKDINNNSSRKIEINVENQKIYLCNENNDCSEINYHPYKYLWTIAIIYGGDNSLNDFVDKDINELQKVKIPDTIKIVGLADYKYQDGAYIYETNDTTGQYNLVKTDSEPDTGDPQYLYNFLKTVYENNPSKYKALIMWNHGYAWKLLQPKQNKLMNEDDTNSDYLYSYEFVRLLNKLNENGIKLNLIGFDECLMGNTEVFWDIANYTDYSVGSELLEPGDGWDYTRLFSKLAKNPEAEPEKFAQYIVDAYAEAYQNYSDITMLAASSKDIKTLVDNINNLTKEFNPDNSNIVDLFKQARENAYNIDVGGDYAENHQLIDLYSFAVQLQDFYPEAKNIVNLIDKMYKKIVGNDDVKGLSIFFPIDKNADDQQYYCTQMNLTCSPPGYYNPFTATNWDEFLQKYLNVVSNQQ
jgi:hypothetical protein